MCAGGVGEVGGTAHQVNGRLISLVHAGTKYFTSQVAIGCLPGFSISVRRAPDLREPLDLSPFYWRFIDS